MMRAIGFVVCVCACLSLCASQDPRMMYWNDKDITSPMRIHHIELGLGFSYGDNLHDSLTALFHVAGATLDDGTLTSIIERFSALSWSIGPPPLREVDIPRLDGFDGYENIAMGASAVSSSVWSGAEASLAIDGNTDGDFTHGSVMHTQVHKEASFSVLLAPVQIAHINIFNRVDHSESTLRNAVVVLLREGVPVWMKHLSLEGNATTMAPPNVVADTVRISRLDLGPLSIAEVQIGVPRSSTPRRETTKFAFPSSLLGSLAIDAPSLLTTLSSSHPNIDFVVAEPAEPGFSPLWAIVFTEGSLVQFTLAFGLPCQSELECIRTHVALADGSLLLLRMQSPYDLPLALSMERVSERGYDITDASRALYLIYHRVYEVGYWDTKSRSEVAALLGESKITKGMSSKQWWKHIFKKLKSHGLDDVWKPYIDEDRVGNGNPEALPYIYHPKHVLSSRLLGVDDHNIYAVRTYDVIVQGKRSFVKQSLGDLAKRECFYLNLLKPSPHFPTMYSYDTQPNYSVCWQEWVEGESFTPSAFVNTFSLDDFRQWMYNVIEGLKVLGALGIWHNNIHLENVITGPSHAPIFSNFHWSDSFTLPQAQLSSVTREKNSITMEYMDDATQAGHMLSSILNAYDSDCAWDQLRSIIKNMTTPMMNGKVVVRRGLRRLAQDFSAVDLTQCSMLHWARMQE